MSDIKFSKYEHSQFHVTKDGHTMFIKDIALGLNRKSHLERVTLEKQNRITELEAKVKNLEFELSFYGDRDLG